MGGGAGKVLINWVKFDKKNTHSILTFDFANDFATDTLQNAHIELFSQCEVSNILKLMQNADIIVIHFWNHPLLYDFLVRNEIPPSRIIIYSHTLGIEAPNLITEKLLKYSDVFIFTSPVSEKYFKGETIVSTGGIEHLRNLKHVKQETCTLGYIGTVDYAKMHPNYLEVHKKINDCKFIIVGGDNEKIISQEADERFCFTGKVNDIRPYLAQMDIFAYLLNPKHYGTAEQVLQEALAAGVVPVVLNNACEKYLVKHNETGLVAHDLDEYIKYIELLRDNEVLRHTLSENGKAFAKENFSLEKFVLNWNELFNDTMKIQKTAKEWLIYKNNISSYDVFLESLGNFATTFIDEWEKIIKEPTWQSENKGTPKQYLKFLGGSELMKINQFYTS